MLPDWADLEGASKDVVLPRQLPCPEVDAIASGALWHAALENGTCPDRLARRRWPARRGRRAAPTLFLHVHKAGGTTLCRQGFF